MPDGGRISASSAFDRGGYPRPQLVRTRWASLDGVWGFGYDDEGVGLTDGWSEDNAPLDRTIQVPFPPESSASGIGDKGFHPVAWYRRLISRAELSAAGHVAGNRLLIRFGAVDHSARVWLNGVFLGEHLGGQSPFCVEATEVVAGDQQSWTLVVRAEDDPLDAAQPRGKQDWQLEPHGIWYFRTSGIWQPVWLESVPAHHVTALNWQPDLTRGRVTLGLRLDRRPTAPVKVTVTLSYGGEQLAETSFTQTEPESSTALTIPRQAHGQAYESLLWSPEHPRLIDATIKAEFPDGSIDQVASYLGLRSVGFAHGHFLLNDRPYYIRAALEQGYWPDTHLAAPSDDSLRAEVQLAKDLGFNTVRLHQKVEDPRYLYWADRLGLMVWGEYGSAYEFSATAVERTTREWLDIIHRDISHPCIVTWVPLNESWGVQHISHDTAQLNFARALYHLTKAVDPSRPVVSNDGWEHADSDLWTIHDYGVTGAEVAANYIDKSTVEEVLSGVGPLGRRMRLVETPDRGQPVIVSEFGGASFAPTHANRSWGYVNADHPDEFEALLRDLFGAVQSSPVLAGFCYTQLTDTLQEANGLADPNRCPKLPVETIRSIVLGEGVDTSSHRRPKQPIEQPNPIEPRA
jgi:beta-galactosidase/beta-glucuronidase